MYYKYMWIYYNIYGYIINTCVCVGKKTRAQALSVATVTSDSRTVLLGQGCQNNG